MLWSVGKVSSLSVSQNSLRQLFNLDARPPMCCFTWVLELHRLVRSVKLLLALFNEDVYSDLLTLRAVEAIVSCRRPRQW